MVGSDAPSPSFTVAVTGSWATSGSIRHVPTSGGSLHQDGSVGCWQTCFQRSRGQKRSAAATGCKYAASADRQLLVRHSPLATASTALRGPLLPSDRNASRNDQSETWWQVVRVPALHNDDCVVASPRAVAATAASISLQGIKNFRPLRGAASTLPGLPLRGTRWRDASRRDRPGIDRRQTPRSRNRSAQ